MTPYRIHVLPLLNRRGWQQFILKCVCISKSRSQWPRGLRRGSVAARLLGLRVRIPPGAWMSDVSVVCRGLRYEMITRPEESYRLWCVVVCDLETS